MSVLMRRKDGKGLIHRRLNPSKPSADYEYSTDFLLCRGQPVESNEWECFEGDREEITCGGCRRMLMGPGR